MFGRALAETVKFESRMGGGFVPIVVEKCVNFIRENGEFLSHGVRHLVNIVQIQHCCGCCCCCSKLGTQYTFSCCFQFLVLIIVELVPSSCEVFIHSFCVCVCVCVFIYLSYSFHVAGLKEEGLFRLPGQVKDIAELKEAFNRGRVGRTVCQKKKNSDKPL